jgi:hypothetical protein
MPPSNNAKAIDLLVFETDEPHPEAKERKGSFGRIFDDLFEQAGSYHDPPLDVRTTMHYIVDDPKNDKRGHVPRAEEIPASTRAVLITRSVYDAHGNDRWTLRLLELLEQLWITRPEIQFSGVCFGHQILSRLLGAMVVPTSGGRPLGTRTYRNGSHSYRAEVVQDK